MTRLNFRKRRSTQAIRQPSVRQWSGPLIGRSPEEAEDYLARMTQLIAQARTHLYFDASFLMWLAKLGEQARDEFFEWQAKVGHQRFHVPLWAAHEFFKHRLKNTIATELSADIKLFDNAAISLYEKIRMCCSDQLFGFKNSGTLFLDEYRRTVQPLRAMLKLAEKSEQFAFGIRQVSTYIDAHLLPGPLQEVIVDIEADERVRNRGTVPPSFQDAHKRGSRRADNPSQEVSSAGDNSFGDLVFWREVLRHAARVRAGALIVLTADRKNDWFENFHGDKGLSEQIRRRIQKPRPVPLPHPLLAREAFDRGAGDLALLDPMYCGVLVERSGSRAANFAAAALDTHLPSPSNKAAAAKSWATRFGAATYLLGAGLELDTEALRETEFDATILTLDSLGTSSQLSKTVVDLVQGIARGDLAQRARILTGLDWETLEQWNTASLVALGRAVLRAAETGDPSALGFLSELRDQAPSLPIQVREPVYFGALGAVYFDDELRPRPSQGSQAALVLLDLVTTPEVRHAATALGSILGSDRKLSFRPGSGKIELVIEVTIRPSADNKSPADLISIRIGGVELTTNLQTEEGLRFTSLMDKPSGDLDVQVGALLDLVVRYHLLPRQLIKCDVDADMIVRVPKFTGIELDD